MGTHDGASQGIWYTHTITYTLAILGQDWACHGTTAQRGRRRIASMRAGKSRRDVRITGEAIPRDYTCICTYYIYLCIYLRPIP